jgi:NAD(P)-dependent dehydrogenase (short-subunit alcohol dehydrogenase family)
MTERGISLKGKVAVVTGAGRGIGKSISLGFARAGASVVTASRTMAEIRETCAEIKSLGAEGYPVTCDIGKSGDIENLVREALGVFSQIDILVNNAGLSPIVIAAENLRDDGWNKVINTNLTGTFMCTREVGKHMIARKTGKIINITSVLGVIASAGQIAYCVSKAGLIMLTRMFAVEWAKYNISVNALGPGMVETRLTEALRKNEKLVQDRISRTPIGRFAKPEDMVGAAIFLASDLSAYMTGQTLFIDGGRLVCA